MDAKSSSFSTLILLILKEIRLERSIHQGALAQSIGKTPNAWTKIENGETTLTTDVLFGACAVLELSPSFVIDLVEKLVPIFNQHGFYFQTYPLGAQEDDLLRLILEYFKTPGYEALKSRPIERISVTSISNPFNRNILPNSVRYCCDPNYKEWIDKGARTSFTDPMPKRI